MNVLAKLSWCELKQLTANRIGWRIKVKAITNYSNNVKVVMRGKEGVVSGNFLRKKTSDFKKVTRKIESRSVRATR